ADRDGRARADPRRACGRPPSRYDLGRDDRGGRCLARERRLHRAAARRQSRPLHVDRDGHGGRPVIAAPPPVALTAAPARIELAGAADETLLVSNPSRGAAVVDVRPAGFALDLHGRPRILVRRDASVHVTVEPHRLVLRPSQTGSATVTSTIAPGARPGDHVALVVLATHTRGTAGVGVRMQLGVVVTVR